jgi:hypothetical protein
MRRSVAGPIATHMQHYAVLSRYEGIREGLGQIGLYDRAAASLPKMSSRMASVKEHESRTDVFARWSILRDGAPRRLAAKPHCLGPTVESDQSVSADSTRFTPAPMSDIGAL